MCLAVDPLHFLKIKIHIHLSRRDIGMSHHLLYTAQVRPILHQMRSKGMTQGMRGNICLDPGSGRVLLDQLPEALAAHPVPAHVDEQRRLVRLVDELRADVAQILLQRPDGGGVKGDDPLLPLAGTVKHPA